MKRSTASWTTAIAASALLAMPVGTWAQQTSPAPSSPSPATTPSEPAAQAPQQQQQPPAAASSIDTDAVKRHLTAARDSLSQMTQLPAAAQLSGDARTQVSQLISNFNELITTNTEWRASYAKLQANLNALVGDQRADESPAPTPAPAAPGAVGTSGTVSVDPTIRAKLVEFRTHLMEFEKAASASASASPAASPATPAETAAASQPSTPATTPSTPAAPPAEPTPSPTPAEPSPTGTSGRTSTPAPTGTTGTRTPSTAPTTATPSPDHQAMQSEAMRHIEAIEAILNGAGTAGTAGSTANRPTAGASAMDREQMEQIRTHLAALRKAINQSDKDK